MLTSGILSGSSKMVASLQETKGVARVEAALLEIGATINSLNEARVHFSGGILPWRPPLILAGGEICLPTNPSLEPTISVHLSWLTLLGPVSLSSLGWFICWLVRAPFGVSVFIGVGPVFVFAAGYVTARNWVLSVAQQWARDRA